MQAVLHASYTRDELNRIFFEHEDVMEVFHVCPYDRETETNRSTGAESDSMTVDIAGGNNQNKTAIYYDVWPNNRNASRLGDVLSMVTRQGPK